MNCKPGDLAVTVFAPDNTPHKHASGNIGRIVEVLRYVGVHHFPAPDVWLCRSRTPLIDARGTPWEGEVLIRDANLRPIRDNNGEDETLTWKTVPQPARLGLRKSAEYLATDNATRTLAAALPMLERMQLARATA